MNLSPHFTLTEFTASDTAARKGIDNTPDAAQVEKLRYLAAGLELVRELVGPLHVNSGYRCPELNAAVGSKPSSQHLKCEAADVTSIDGMGVRQMCELVAASDIPFDQIIQEYGAWMHISFAQDREPRGSILTIDRQGTRGGLA